METKRGTKRCGTRHLAWMLAGLFTVGFAASTASAQPVKRSTVVKKPVAASDCGTATSTRGSGCLNRLNVSGNGHSLGNSYQFAMISHYMYPHAYRPKAERFSDFKPLATALFKRWGMNKVDIYEQGEDDNIQYAVMSNDDVVIVAFRGSDNMLGKDGWADWVATDTRLLQKEITSWGKAEYQNKRGVTVTEGPGVHKGFYYAYRDVRHNINSRIKAHGGDKKKLFITGHSLGAALATLCAIDQGYSSEWIMPGRDTKQYRAQAVYTYGSPRVGNGLFRKLYNSKKSAGGTAALNTHRYVNRADGICMGPPDSYAFDLACQIYDWLTPHDVKKYTHVGRTCNITSSKIARDDDEYRGTGDMKYHDSKAYCDQIYRFHIKPRSWAKEMPLPPCHGSEGIFSN